MRAAALLGFKCHCAGPKGPGFSVEESVLEECEALCRLTGGEVKIFDNAEDAVRDVDIVYTDSWMSYHIDKKTMEERVPLFKPFQVNEKLMSLTKKDAVFMNCLPASRGMEQTAEVIDGPQSIVFDQAENRKWAQSALLMYLLDAPIARMGVKKQRILCALGGNALLKQGEKGTF